MKKDISLETKFWKNVAIGNEDECWEWKGESRIMGGKSLYGFFKIEGERYSTSMLAYVFAHNEDYTERKTTYHMCDSTTCCNPAHLSLDMKVMPTTKRFWAKVNKNGSMPAKETGCSGKCWIWIGKTRNRSNAGKPSEGVFNLRKKNLSAHRVSYEMAHNVKLAKHEHIHRLCGNILCVNPDHLERGKPTGRKGMAQVGAKHGMLTFIGATDQRKRGRILWEVRCDCGTIKIVNPSPITGGKVISCGCVWKKTSLENCKKNTNTKRKYTPRMASMKCVWRTTYSECDFDLFIILSQQDCFYCGARPSNWMNDRKVEGGEFIYNGLDRLDSSKTHTPDNIVPCCWTCNRMKRNIPVNDFLAHINRIHARLEQLPIPVKYTGIGSCLTINQSPI